MIPHDVLTLLTEAAGGDLSPATARRLKRVLAESPDARRLYESLRADARKLRALPFVPPPADLTDRVMAAVWAAPAPAPAVPGQIIRRELVFTPPPRRWVPVAVAASLLAVVVAGSFLAFRPAGDRGRGDLVADAGKAAGPSRPAAKPAPGRGHESWEPWLPAQDGALSSAPAGASGTPAPTPSPAVPDNAVAALAPPPRPVERDLYYFPPTPPAPPLQSVDVRVPFLVPLAELDRDDVRQRLGGELARDAGARVDLFARDPQRGLDHVLAALRSAGVHLHQDPAVQDRSKRRGAPVAYAVFTDALTPAEVRDLLARVSADDAKAAPSAVELLHVTPVGSVDQREVRDLFGVDLSAKRPAADGPSKPISAGTVDQVTGSLAGKGAARKGDKAAAVVPFAPSAARVNPAASRDVRQYLDRRGERKAGAVPVMIVVRPVAG